MAWNSFATPLIGKAVRAASRLAHGGGSAFPGKIVEQIDPQFLARTLQQLPLGVVLTSFQSVIGALSASQVSLFHR